LCRYPRQVQFVDSLPMTATGKVLRRDLRALG
jgi:acetyl-CoA synthetase